jgi:hypothetical protein
MKYAVLIYGDESAWVGAPESTSGDLMTKHRAFISTNSGAIVGGEALEPTSMATSIRDGDVTDGPYLETKEALGGFYLIEAADLDAAIAVAKQVPTYHGGVEVRPVWETGAM